MMTALLILAKHNMSDDVEQFENSEAEELLEKAANFYAENKLEAAETVLSEVTQKFPDLFEAWAAYGDFLLNVGEPNRALAPLRKAVKLAFHEGIGHYLLGAAYTKVGRFHLAERELETAEKFLADKADIFAHLGRVKVMLGKLDEGRKLIFAALKDDPENPFIKADMAQSFVVEKNFAEALRWAESIQSGEPFFKENAASIRKLKEDFDALSSEKREESRQQSLVGENGNKARIEMMLALGDDGNGLTEDDIAEITEEMKLYGLTGQITIVKDPEDPKSKSLMEFIKMHEELGLGMGRKPEKLSSSRICELEKTISGGADISEKKKAIVRLAVSGAKESLEALARFLKNPEIGELKFWSEIAYDECRMLNSGISESEPSVIFRHIDEDKK